jgi:hypothetical protein
MYPRSRAPHVSDASPTSPLECEATKPVESTTFRGHTSFVWLAMVAKIPLYGSGMIRNRRLGKNMDTWLPTWLGIALGVIGIVAGEVRARRAAHRETARLVCSYETAPLVRRTGKGNRLSVLYNDDPIADPHLVTLRMTNRGGKAVRPSDVPDRPGRDFTPLKVSFNGTRILSMTVTLDGKLMN